MKGKDATTATAQLNELYLLTRATLSKCIVISFVLYGILMTAPRRMRFTYGRNEGLNGGRCMRVHARACVYTHAGSASLKSALDRRVARAAPNLEETREGNRKCGERTNNVERDTSYRYYRADGSGRLRASENGKDTRKGSCEGRTAACVIVPPIFGNYGRLSTDTLINGA